VARHGWLGLGLVAVAWPLDWALDGLRTHVLFFPLWLGYVLAVDAWTLRRTGTSPLARSLTVFLARFAISIPLWWLFELFNLRLGNWEYVGREHFGDLGYFLLCSLSFSTVVPAVFTTAELVRSFAWPRRFVRGPRIPPSSALQRGLVVAGLAALGLTLAFPTYAYPLLWIWGVLLLEPLCRRAGRRSFLDTLAVGDWSAVAALFGGVLVCGFFWEMWNVASYPKWIYHVPGVEFAYLFEMPLLGYLGYLPFSLELVLFAELLAPRTVDPLIGPITEEDQRPELDPSKGSASAASRTGSRPPK